MPRTTNRTIARLAIVALSVDATTAKYTLTNHRTSCFLIHNARLHSRIQNHDCLERRTEQGTQTQNSLPPYRQGSPHLSSRAYRSGSLSAFNILRDSNEKSASSTRKQLARELMEANAMPPLEYLEDTSELDLSAMNKGHVPDASHTSFEQYDLDLMTPIESEFHSLMTTFVTYSKQDIQSLTTTSTRYYQYFQENLDHLQQQKQPHPNENEQLQHTKNKHHAHNPRKRTKEEGIRYRALYEGVQSGALEPAVMRSFSVLFEDYLPIRLAGRRIYNHLKHVMEEVRKERQGEILRAREVTGWDWMVDHSDNGNDWGSSSNVETKEHIVEYAHRVWDGLVDEALLLEHSLLESDGEEGQSEEGGVVSLHQLAHLGIDQIIVRMSCVHSCDDLESIVRRAVFEEEAELMGRGLGTNKAKDVQHAEKGGKNADISFVTFMRALQHCIEMSGTGEQKSMVFNMLQQITRSLDDRRNGQSTDDTSTLLAKKAINSGSANTCKKRQKNSDKFDEYVSTFKVWKEKLLGGQSDSPSSTDLSHSVHKTDNRRLDILRGCFVGASNEKVVAALKIVYMDYAALRLAGDLIFKLMSKVVK